VRLIISLFPGISYFGPPSAIQLMYLHRLRVTSGSKRERHFFCRSNRSATPCPTSCGWSARPTKVVGGRQGRRRGISKHEKPRPRYERRGIVISRTLFRAVRRIYAIALTRAERRDSRRSTVFLCNTPPRTPRAISGWAARRAAWAAVLSPLAIASSTAFTKVRMRPMRAPLITARRAFRRIRFLADW